VRAGCRALQPIAGPPDLRRTSKRGDAIQRRRRTTTIIAKAPDGLWIASADRLEGNNRLTRISPSCLTLVWAVLDLYISHATNGIKFTQLERQRLKSIRYQPADRAISEEVNTALTDDHPEPAPRRR
jgi:hypothetical protein